MNNEIFNKWDRILLNKWDRILIDWETKPILFKNTIIYSWKFSHFLFSTDMDSQLENYLAGRVSKSLTSIFSPNTIVKVIRISLSVLFCTAISFILCKSLVIGFITLAALLIFESMGQVVQNIIQQMVIEKERIRLWVEKGEIIRGKFKILDKIKDCLIQLNKSKDTSSQYPLPQEVYGYIFSKCDGNALTQLTMTSKHFFSIIFTENQCKNKVIKFKTDNFLNYRNKERSKENAFDEATLSILKEVMIKHLESNGLAFSIFMFLVKADDVLIRHGSALSNRNKFLYHLSDDLAEWTKCSLTFRSLAAREDLHLARLVKDLIQENEPSASTLDIAGLKAKIDRIDQQVNPKVA